MARTLADRLRQLRGRTPLILLTGVCLVVVTAAVSSASGPEQGLRFAPGGHWMANPALDLVFHINGGGQTVDAQTRIEGIEPNSQVVQGDTSGYVVGQTRIIEFGKSDLAVEQTLTAPTGERPVAIEATGGPYLVYREAGSVVRLGDAAAAIPAGGALGEPVATADGTLWLHRLDSGIICKLARDAERISCPAAAPTGNLGVLTVVRDRPVFVDTTADTLSPVSDAGLGKPTRLGVDAPPTARVAPIDVAGRVAVLDPDGQRMYLVDATTVGTDQEGAAPVTVALPNGTYTTPSATRSSFVLLDRKRNTLLTYSGTGEPLRTVTVPADVGEPSLTRGGDGRVYVDGTEGRYALVVDQGGGVGQVPIPGGDPPPGSAPVTPGAPPTSGAAGPTTAPASTAVATPTPDPPAGPPGTAGTPRTTGPPRSTGTPRTSAPPSRTPPPAIPASPPGVPAGLRAEPQGDALLASWGAAAANGAAVSAYHVTWAGVSGGGGGSSTRPGDARSFAIGGLTRGVAYRITVVAQNSAGRGASASVQATLPVIRTVTVSRGRTEAYESSCRVPECGLMRVVMRGFQPNTSYQVDPRSSHPTYSNPGAARTTDDAGNLTFEAFHFGEVGYEVWVEVDGMQSNRFEWVSG
ncbi:fibronectin type III domain-containing protein [Micromonospora sp. NBC_01813]|uniref:fibronectin type III domain-containing protein n=1 Tax=Micromonospora sp. NBC_01813 TaxID=2975988 RepID=UPI002DDA9B3D|nr:fibronectin type III domain-containing protein [Micromonospora sp. NBC_01813]WSA06260.1 fibronectin type III domain-containing protein [Micromonospora sp. NBC_01813]